MPYPINYDFGKHWKDNIVLVLDHPKVQSAIRKGVNEYLSIFPTKKKYLQYTAPADYSSKDGYMMITDRQRKKMLKMLRMKSLLPKKFLTLEKKVRESEDDDDDLWIKLEEMKDKILEPYFSWDKIKNNLETYYLSGSCHWWAPTFELTLAKLVMPNETWKVQFGKAHTTVLNKSKTKVFDLLYWCDNDRLENYLFGDPILEVDPTFGGKSAYLDSVK